MKSIGERWVLISFELFLLAFTVAQLVLGIFSYFHLSFTSDGMYYFSAIRNLVDGLGFYEGPVFEYLLGNHSYVTLYLLTPLVAVFRSPIVLLVTSVMCHVSATYLLFASSRRLGLSFLVSWLLGVSYLFYPISFYLLFTNPFLFQPDSLLPPLVLGMIYAILVEKQRSFLICWCLLLLTKEEYLVIALPLLLWFWLIAQAQGKHFFFSRRMFSRIWTSCILVATLMIIILLYYRNLNQLHYAVKSAHFHYLLNKRALWMGVIAIGKIILPVTPVLLLGSTDKAEKKLLMASVGLLVGRILGSILIYGEAPYVHWCNAIIPPVLFGTSLFIIHRKQKICVGDRPIIISLFFVLTLILWQQRYNLTFNNLVAVDWTMKSKQYDELEKLEAQLPPPKPKEAMLTSEYLMPPFLQRRSHIGMVFFQFSPIKVQEELLRNVRFILISKLEANPNFSKKIMQIRESKMYLESANFLILELKPNS